MSKQKSDLSRAFSEDGAIKTHVGGQALIEGIMMRGKYNWAAAVRMPNGEIHTEEHELISGKKKNVWMSWPLIRGCVALVESLGLGYKALEVATEHAFDRFDMSYAMYLAEGVDPRTASDEEKMKAAGFKPEEIEEELGGRDNGGASEVEALSAKVDSNPSREKTDVADSGSNFQDGLGKGVMTASMVFGIIMGVVLFIVAPAFVTNLIVGEYDSNFVLWNVVDGVLRVAIFVFYIWLIGRMKDIKRMFSYHGAEHKTIHCYEHGLELTPENCRSFPRLHVRCGTAFLIMVMVLAIIVYTVIPVNALISAWGVPDGAPKLILVILVRIIFMPVIAGLSYEINVKWAGTHPDNPLVKVILWPGMQMQYLTTNEPDDSMLECAIASMKLVLEREERAEMA